MTTVPPPTQRRPAPTRWLLAALVAAFAAAPSRTALAAPNAVEVENVRVGFGERYKTGSWTPVWIQLRGGPQGFAGLMDVVVEDEDGTETTVGQRVQLAAGQSQRITTYVRPGSMNSDFARLVFRDANSGRRVANDVVVGSLLGSNAPDALTPDDLILVGLGKPQGLELVPRLPGFNADRSVATNPNSRAMEVAVARPGAAEDLLPGRWYGYDGVDVVTLDTNDKEMLAAVTGPRGEALRRWVERGGHLVVAVNANWQAVNESLLGPMLPAKLTGQIQVEPWEALEAFSGGSKPIAPAEANQTRVAKFEDVEARGGTVIASTLATPLVVRGAYGFGRVTVIGVDVDTNPFASWTDRNLFWVKTLDLRSPPTDANAMAGNTGRFVQNQVQDMASRLVQALEQFQGVTLVPFGWVAAFIFLYILLIGPGDYFFLKKVLKRMELTWITFPTIVVTVSLVAYYAAYKIKGSDLRVNKIDVIDLDQVTKRARGTTWFNVFSPQNRDYDIAVNPVAIDRPTPPEAAEPAPMPSGTEMLVSWFGSPDAGLRGMNSSRGGFGLGGSGYRYEPMGRPERLEGVRVKIWSTKAFSGRWDGPSSAVAVDADLTPVGTDRLDGTVTNRLDIPLRDVIVAYGNQVYFQVGTIEPGATAQVDPSLTRFLGNHLQEQRPSFMPDNVYSNSNETIDRANLVRELMFHDSDQSGQEPVRSRALHDIDLTGQLALNRPMLVARIDRPASQLVLGNSPGPVRTDQTTLLRVILPLKPESKPNDAAPAAAAPAPAL